MLASAPTTVHQPLSYLSPFSFLCCLPLHSPFPRRLLVSARGKKKVWAGHVSLHFALLHRTRRMTRDPKRSGTLYSVAELAGDFIEVDLDRSVRPEERLRAREKNRCPKPAPLFFASFFLVSRDALRTLPARAREADD